jgi:alpha-glucosidase
VVWTLLLTLGCRTQTLEVGDFIVDIDRKTGDMDISHVSRGVLLEDARLSSGEGSAEITMQYGSFLFEDVEAALSEADSFERAFGEEGYWSINAYSGGDFVGLLTLQDAGDTLLIGWLPETGNDRVSLSAACAEDDHFMGFGSHAMDVDHVGQSFPLWVSEPGIGKSETEEPADDWFVTGTRHASSFPMPWLLRPEANHGLLALTTGRVEVDLCDTDPGRFSMQLWDGAGAPWALVTGKGPLDVVEHLTDITGRPELQPAWTFAPWNDAVRGVERVMEVATALRESGAASSVIWSEDWKGAHEDVTGYHLDGEWFLDESLYPDAATTASTLEALGFKWFAYFSPFLFEETETWDDALASNVILLADDGEPYTFFGATLEPTSMVDLSTVAGQDWAIEKMQAALDLGFDGWMADFAEWLPTDVVLRGGQDPMLAHNAWPLWWQETNSVAIEGQDAIYFSRSGWSGTSSYAPVVWGGDQRTSFDADDGFPTVIPLGLGLAASGVPVFTHDIAGYASVGNDSSDKELWFRWAALGAYSPVMRTHHGAYDVENWQFDSDEETLAYWAEVSREHMRLFPYRYGLAKKASERGTPMILPTGFLFEGEDWGRMDAWMLGEALLVAPVLERGAEGREVDLPGGVDWYDWATLAPASGGWVEAALDEIPVFAASGTTVPTFAQIPDTLVATDAEGLLDLDDVDGARVVYLFGGGGEFTEGDGTTYSPSGSPSGSGEVTVTLTEGSAEVAGVTVHVSGSVEREYTFVVP